MDKLIDSINSIKVTDVLAVLEVLVAIAIVLVFFLSRNFVSRVIIGIVYKIRGKKDDVRKNPMFRPLKLFLSLLGIWIAIKMFPVNSQVRMYSDIVFQIVAMITVTQLICSLITPNSILFKTFLSQSKSKAVNNFLCKVIQVVIWIVAFFLILYLQHVNLTGLAAGLGLTSAIIALAAQDLVKNLLAGMAILSDKPFEIGDWIQVGEYEGSVVDITFRSTRIKTASTTIITIPNIKVTTESVVNVSRMKQRRIELNLALAMTTPAEEIKRFGKRLKIVIENIENVVPDSAQINLFSITNYSYEYKIYFYIDIIKYVDYLHKKQEILCKIIDVIQKENIQLAYPTQTMFLKNGDVSNEDFMPGNKKNEKKHGLKQALENFGKLRGKENEEHN